MSQVLGMSRRMVNGQLWGPLLRKPGTGSQQDQDQHLSRNSGYLDQNFLDQSPAVGSQMIDVSQDFGLEMCDDMMLGSPAPTLRRFSQPNVPVMGGEPVIQGEDQGLLTAVPSLRADRTPALGGMSSNSSNRMTARSRRDFQINHMGTLGFTSPMIAAQEEQEDEDAEDSCSPASDFDDDFVTPLQGLSLETPKVLNADYIAVMSPPQIKLEGSIMSDDGLDLHHAWATDAFYDDNCDMPSRNNLRRKKEYTDDEMDSNSIRQSRSKSRRRLMSADSNEEFKQFHQARVLRGNDLPQVSPSDIDRASAAHTIAQQIVRWSETMQVVPDEVFYEGKNPVLFSVGDEESPLMSGSDESIEFSESDVLYRETQDEHIRAALELPKYARDEFLKSKPSLLSQCLETQPTATTKPDQSRFVQQELMLGVPPPFQDELTEDFFSIPPAAAPQPTGGSQRTTRFALR